MINDFFDAFVAPTLEAFVEYNQLCNEFITEQLEKLRDSK
jgi:hypothetical protein